MDVPSRQTDWTYVSLKALRIKAGMMKEIGDDNGGGGRKNRW